MEGRVGGSGMAAGGGKKCCQVPGFIKTANLSSFEGQIYIYSIWRA